MCFDRYLAPADALAAASKDVPPPNAAEAALEPRFSRVV
jgi:hypothetical protein